jgi:ribosomal protein S18 acetylase RimI-like enzyme
MTPTASRRVSIRRAVPADAAAFASLCIRTFRDTYSGPCDPAEVERHIAAHFTDERIAAELIDPAASILVAADGDDLVGYAVLRPGSTTDCVTGPAPVELARLYVERARFGTGVAALLMRACHEESARRGGATIWLSVWDRNERAMAFYRKHGFALAGTMPFDFGGTIYEDLVMERKVEMQPRS